MIELMKQKQECGLCQTKIWEVVGEKLKKTDEYNEVDVQLDNQSKMTVGVCRRHVKPKQSDLPIMTEKAHQGWLEELAFGVGNKEWVDSVGLKINIIGVM